jgi:cardiolipin synthase
VFTRALGVLLCASLGCTAVPGLGSPLPRLRAESPRVVMPRGEMSEARGEALLERQDKKHEPTLLDRHLATMQRISDTPLVAGNAARLLIDGPAS